MKKQFGSSTRRACGRGWAGLRRHVISSRAALAGLGGLAVVLSFAPIDWSPLVWLGPALFLAAVDGRSWRARAVLGFVHGLVIQGGGFYWIAYAGGAFGQHLVGGKMAGDPIWWLGGLVFVAWWAGSSVFWALWGAALVPTGPAGWRWWWPMVSLVALEAWFPRVFPWRLGDSAHGWPAMGQAARWLGVEGLSALTVIVGTCLYAAWRTWLPADGRGRDGRRAAYHLAIALAIVLFWIGAGYVRLNLETEATTTVRIGYVQPNIRLSQRYDGNHNAKNEIVRTLLDSTRELLPEDPAVVVWSEGIFPRFQHPDRHDDSLCRPEDFVPYTRDLPCALIFGVAGPNGENRAVFLGPIEEGRRQQLDHYDKRVRLAFGEYYPLRGLIEGLGVPIAPDMPAGERIVIWLIDGVETGISICFEGLLPDTGPELVAAGARLQVNITEDKWFGDRAEPEQHLALTAMRVLEADLPMVRVTNGGISAWIDRYGRLRETVPVGVARSGVFEVEVAPEVAPAPVTQRAHAVCPWLFILVVAGRAALGWRAHRWRARARTPMQ